MNTEAVDRLNNYANDRILDKETDDILEEAIQRIYLKENTASIVGELARHAFAMQCNDLLRMSEILLQHVTPHDLANLDRQLQKLT